MGFLQLRIATDSGDSVPGPRRLIHCCRIQLCQVYPGTQGLSCASDDNDGRLLRGVCRR